MNIYFFEYVLEDSNVLNYFNVYVVGFLFFFEMYVMNNINVSVGLVGLGNSIEEKLVFIVWYSNEVRLIYF